MSTVRAGLKRGLAASAVLVALLSGCTSVAPTPVATVAPIALKTYEIDENALLSGPVDGTWILVREVAKDGTPIEAPADFRALAHPVTVTIAGTKLESSVCGVIGTIEGGYGSFNYTASQDCVYALNARLRPRLPDFVNPQAEKLANTLAAVTTARGDGQVLELSGTNGILTFERPERVSIDSLTGTTWNLRSMDRGNRAVLLGEASWLRFDADGTVTGATECRDFGAEWTLVDSVVTIRTAIPSSSVCPFGTGADGNADINDARMLVALHDGAAFDLNGGILTIVDVEHGFTLRYSEGQADGDGLVPDDAGSVWDLSDFGDRIATPPLGDWQLLNGDDYLGPVTDDAPNDPDQHRSIYTFTETGFTTGSGCRTISGSLDVAGADHGRLFTVTSRGGCVFDHDATGVFEFDGLAERGQTALESTVELRVTGDCLYAVQNDSFLRFVRPGNADGLASLCGRP